MARRTWRSANWGKRLVHDQQVDLPGWEQVNAEAAAGLERGNVGGGHGVDDVDLAPLDLQHPLVVVVHVEELDRVQVGLAGLPVIGVGLQGQRVGVGCERRLERERPGTDGSSEELLLALAAEVGREDGVGEHRDVREERRPRL